MVSASQLVTIRYAVVMIHYRNNNVRYHSLHWFVATRYAVFMIRYRDNNDDSLSR